MYYYRLLSNATAISRAASGLAAAMVAGSFDGLELWVEGIDSSHVIGAESWTGVAAA